MKSPFLKGLAVLAILGVLVGCGETFTGTYVGKLRVINSRGCNGGRSETNDITVVARIDGDRVTLRPYSEGKPAIQALSKLEAKFTDSLNFNLNNVSEDKQDRYSVQGRGDFSQDRQFLSFTIQVIKPEYDSSSDAPSEDSFCKETYEVIRAQLEE